MKSAERIGARGRNMRCAVPSVPNIYINNRYFIYYYLLIQPLSPTPAWVFGIFALRSRTTGASGTAVFGRKSRMADFQRFRVAQGRHGGGTAVFGAFRRPFGKPPTRAARPSPVLGGLGRPRTGPAAFRGGGGLGGTARRPYDPRKGFLWPLVGLLWSPRRPTACGRPSAISGPWGPRVASRRFPAISDNKTGEVMSEILGRLLTQNF